MGIKKYPFKGMFQAAIWCIKKNIPIPSALAECVVGKENSGIMATLNRSVSLKTIGNACLACYNYKIPDSLKEYHGPVAFWLGEREPYPRKSARLLKGYLPQMKTYVCKGMGHGQFLHEHPQAYAKMIKNTLSIQRQG